MQQMQSKAAEGAVSPLACRKTVMFLRICLVWDNMGDEHGASSGLKELGM